MNNDINNYTNEHSEVQLIGNTMVFPFNTPVDKAYNIIENSSTLPKSRIWYIMVERTESGIQIARYQPAKGVNLQKIADSLKNYYKSKINDLDLLEMIDNIEVSGEEKFVFIKNIPDVTVNNVKFSTMAITHLTQLLKIKSNL